MFYIHYTVRLIAYQFSCSVMSGSAIPWTAACQASLPITTSKSLLKHMSTESVMPSKHLILCCLLLLLPSIFPNIRVFPNESVLCIRWPKCWNFSFSINVPTWPRDQTCVFCIAGRFFSVWVSGFIDIACMKYLILLFIYVSLEYL